MSPWWWLTSLKVLFNLIGFLTWWAEQCQITQNSIFQCKVGSSVAVSFQRIRCLVFYTRGSRSFDGQPGKDGTQFWRGRVEVWAASYLRMRINIIFLVYRTWSWSCLQNPERVLLPSVLAGFFSPLLVLFTSVVASPRSLETSFLVFIAIFNIHFIANG